MSDIRLHSFIQSILARCLAKSSDNMGKISSIDNRNHIDTCTYMKMPQRVRACKPALSERPKRMYVKDKAKVINRFMDSIMNTVSDHGGKVTYRVLSEVADDQEMAVLKESVAGCVAAAAAAATDAAAGLAGQHRLPALGKTNKQPPLVLAVVGGAV